MNEKLEKLKRLFAEGNNAGRGNPYEVDITQGEVHRLAMEGNSPYTVCNDCAAIVLKEHVAFETEDYGVCLWCENGCKDEEWEKIGKA